MNSFTSSSRKYFLVIAAFFFLFYGSYALFLYKPHLFYWRAWEYIDEVAYTVPHRRHWKGFEQGDEERDNPFIPEHHKRKNVVSCNKLGYRSCCFDDLKPNLLVVGDSNTWGSGLSNDETVAWQLAQRLNVPTYNLGKMLYRTHHLINNQEFSETKFIVEIPLRGHLWIIDRYEPFVIDEQSKPFLDLYLQKDGAQRSIGNLFKIHPNRFFPISKLIRSLQVNKRVKRHLSKRIKFSQPPGDPNFAKIYTDKVAKQIREISDMYEAAGYTYIFGVIPDSCAAKQRNGIPQHIVTEDIELAKLLEEENIHYVDIAKAFRESSDVNSYFLPTDSHISRLGARVIAEELEKYLRAHFSTEIDEIALN